MKIAKMLQNKAYKMAAMVAGCCCCCSCCCCCNSNEGTPDPVAV